MNIKPIKLQYRDKQTGEWIDTKTECNEITIETSFIKAKVIKTGETINVIPMCNHSGMFLELYHDDDEDMIYEPKELEFDLESYRNFPWELWCKFIPQERIEKLNENK